MGAVRRTRAGLWTATAAALLATDAAVVADDSGPPDFSRYVALGDSVTAGYGDGSLYDGTTADPPVAVGQRQSYAVRLAASMGTPAVLPIIPFPGPPGLAALTRNPGVCAFGPTLVTSTPGTSGRADPFAVATILAVPGQTLGAALHSRWSIDPTDLSTVDSLEDLVLGLPHAFVGAPPRSQVETAVALHPTFVSVWLGTNDVLAAAIAGDASKATPPTQFAADVAEFFAAIDGAAAKGVVANVPDVTVLPYLVSRRDLRNLLNARFRAADLRFQLRDAGMAILFGLGPRDYAIREPATFAIVESILSGAQITPIPDRYVLRRREIAVIRRAARSYNRAIAAAAASRDWALADVDRALRRLARRGAVVDGRRLTTKYLGGVFGVDGVHPTPTGHAILAQVFVDAINAHYGTSLVGPDAAAVAATDPFRECVPESRRR